MCQLSLLTNKKKKRFPFVFVHTLQIRMCKLKMIFSVHCKVINSKLCKYNKKWPSRGEFMWSFAAICWLKPFTASTAKPVKFILLTSKK